MYRLVPSYQNYVWGGNRIPHHFGRTLPEGRYAESWEVSDRTEGMSRIENGPTFQELIKSGVLGRTWEKFPILVKIIDAKENLSVQIHPDEESAIRLKAEPKSEMWIALERSSVYAGLQDGVTESDFLRALKKNELESLLKKFVLEKGEAINIPAGTIHAICGDSLLLEVQQNSNTTYRLYDWGRVGRELHLEAGLSCVHWERQKPAVISYKPGIIIANSYFTVERHPKGKMFSGCQILFCVQTGLTFFTTTTADLREFSEIISIQI